MDALLAELDLPRALVGPDQRRRLLEAAREIPLFRLGGLECRLTGEGPVDLWVCPSLDPDGHERAAAWMKRWPELAPLGRHLERHGVPGGGTLTLEFDLHGPEPCPLPSVFLTFPQGARAEDLLERLWTAAEKPEDPAIRGIVGRHELAGLAFMASRPGAPARVMLRGYPEHRADDCFAGLADRIVVALEPGSRRVSVEGYLSQGWPELLDRLQARGLCDPERAEALLRWPGRTATAWTALNHLKIALEPDGTRNAKAYPAFGRD